MDPRPRSKMLAHKRSMTLDDKDQILPLPSGGDDSPLNPLPSHSPSHQSTFAQPSPAPSMHSHTRSMSHADVVKQGKRLSLHFPIQPAAGSPSPGFSPRSRPQSWVGTPITSPDIVPSPTNETNFMSVLATQERRVLELREELVKAEEDLKSLKRNWATHESIKKRNDARNVTKLQPLNTTLANFPGEDDDTDGSTLWLQKEMERRKALLSSTKTSQRKVFSGSKHMRALSLLSPDKATYTPSFPQPHDIRDPPKDDQPKRQSLSRTSTTPDIASQIANTYRDEGYDMSGLPNIQREALLRTGKQMATDFKDGLLTFIEDIRQATVGEEGVNGTESSGAQQVIRGQSTKGRKLPDGRPTLKRASSSTKKLQADKGEDIGNSFWKEHGLAEPKITPATKVVKGAKSVKAAQKTPVKNALKDDFEENWDSWDTPNDKYLAKQAPSISSSDESDEPEASTPMSARSSTRTSTSSADNDSSSRDPKRNSIPWPDLVKLSPTNLKRTASHLMKEWEKNLTPPPESRDGTFTSGDYIGRSASPADPMA